MKFPPGHRRWSWLCLLLLPLASLPPGCTPEIKTSDFSGKTPMVRVLLLSAQSSVTVFSPIALSVKAGGSTHTLPPQPGDQFVASLYKGTWQFGTARPGTGEVTLIPGAEGAVSINGKPYRGRYRLVPRTDSTFDVVNDVDVEGYLKSVVAGEALPQWLDAAFKAQAVAARTYALYNARMASHGTRFDLFADTRSQVYGGISAENRKAVAAVDATYGLVVAAGPPGQERIFKAYFSACCGGVGQSAADAFGDPASPELGAQAVGTLCSESPRFSWPAVIVTKIELTRRFKHYGQNHNLPLRDIGPVNRIDVAARSPLGRPIGFAVTDTANRRILVGNEDMRQAINFEVPPKSRVFSSFFDIQNGITDIRFVNGHGDGHGVGLCQWCAQVRAEQGMPFEQIVTTAYPTSVLIQAYTR